MFPTIYGVALQGLGEDTKFGAAGLVMAILGGALMPLVQGASWTRRARRGLHRARRLPGLRDAATRCSTSAPAATAAQLVTEGAHLSPPEERELSCRSVAGVSGTCPAARRAGLPPCSASASPRCGDDEERVTARAHHQAGDQPVLRDDEGGRAEDRRRRQRRAAHRDGARATSTTRARWRRVEDMTARGEGHPHHAADSRPSCPRSRRRAARA